MNTGTDNIVCVHRVTKKKVFEQLMLASVFLARRRHGRQKVSIPECNLTGRLEEQSTITLLPVRLFIKLYVHTNNVVSAGVHV